MATKRAESHLQDAAAAAVALSATVKDALAEASQVKPATPFPQAVMAFYFAVKQVGKLCDNVEKAVKGLAIDRDNGGEFQPGRYFLDFGVSSKRSPQWKDEAAAMALSNARLKGRVEALERVRKASQTVVAATSAAARLAATNALAELLGRVEELAESLRPSVTEESYQETVLAGCTPSNTVTVTPRDTQSAAA